MAEKRKYDSTVARIAGNITPALLQRFIIDSIDTQYGRPALARAAVEIAREIVAEVERTEPKAE